MTVDDEIRKLAMLGARARLVEIDAERERLLAMFPELARKPRGPIAKAAEPAVLFDADTSKPRERSRVIRRRHRRKHGPEVVADALDRFRRGEYLSDVSRALDIVPTVLQRWADKHKVKVAEMPMEERVRRNREARTGDSPRVTHGDRDGAIAYERVSPETKAELMRRVAAGEGITAVARELGIVPSTARGWIAATKPKKKKKREA